MKPERSLGKQLRRELVGEETGKEYGAIGRVLGMNA